jgi:hypothetical protein
MITIERFDEVMTYNAEDGCFKWIKTNKTAGSIKQHGYREIQIDKKSYLAHRLAWFFYYGHFPDKEIDHINHNKLDNRMENLREVDRKENNKNKTIQKNNTSGVQGVIKCSKTKKWLARIKVDGKPMHLGVFANKENAIAIRKEAEVKYGFHVNHGQE